MPDCCFPPIPRFTPGPSPWGRGYVVWRCRPCSRAAPRETMPVRGAGVPGAAVLSCNFTGPSGLYWIEPMSVYRPLLLVLSALPCLAATFGTVVPHTQPLADLAIDEARKRVYGGRLRG